MLVKGDVVLSIQTYIPESEDIRIRRGEACGDVGAVLVLDGHPSDLWTSRLLLLIIACEGTPVSLDGPCLLHRPDGGSDLWLQSILSKL